MKEASTVVFFAHQ